MGLPGGSGRKESACNAGDLGLIPIPGREDPLDKRMAPTPLFLPGEFHGQRSLAGYHGITESDTTERLSLTILFCPICLSCHISALFFLL